MVTYLQYFCTSFGMMITQLNVINVFTDDYGQIKPEGKCVKDAF